MKSPIAYFLEWEKKTPNQVFLRQPKGKTWKEITYKEDYKGHGLREQALEMENCVKEKYIESKKMTHSDSIAVIEIMDMVREKIKLSYKN